MRVLLFIQAIVIECFCIYLLANSSLDRSGWLLLGAGHAVACACFTGWCWLMLPAKYCNPLLGSLCSLFLFHLLLPVVGIAGTTCVMLLVWFLPKQQHRSHWQSIEVLRLPSGPVDIMAHPPLGAGALRDILVHHDSPEQRSLAVSTISHLPRKQSIPLLQLALKDVSDDIRLLAYAALESIENQINEQIACYQQRYEQQPHPDLAHVIAQHYWELCYLGMAEGILRKHYLAQAEQYLRGSFQHTGHADYSLLLGRVLLEQQRPEEAMAYLKDARQQGGQPEQVVPYLAEAAYQVKDYDQAREYIFSLADKSGNRLSQVKEYWL
ncbi:HEAT repeat domain-containing protein [Oceanisphaera marina]|nr:HEAT repeat domain-containing protein [Oceanisphaera marina]